MDQVWDIFYHFKIDDKATDTLIHQSEKLFKTAESIETWSQSPYGSCIKFVDGRTLVEIRRYWQSFAGFPRIPSNRLDKLLKAQSKISQSASGNSGNNKSASHTTGILWAQAATSMNSLFKRYWETGTLCSKDSDAKSSTKLNPTFVYTSAGEEFNLHPGTFPQGFHLTSALTPIRSDSSNLPTAGIESTIVETMKRQFQAWAEAFRASRSTELITLRFFCGDALAFCHALDTYGSTHNPSTGVFASPWRAAQINFGGTETNTSPIPTSFDIIDTSHLSDHVGLLNVLLAASPLLKKNSASQSVLYTETSLWAGKEPIRPFLDRIYTTIPTFSALFGISPRAYISGFTTHFNIHEMLSPQHIDHYHERVAWSDPSRGDRYASRQRVSMDAKDLSRTVYSIYDKMFASEQVMVMGGVRMMTPIPLHYHRETLVVLWKLVKRRITLRNGGWDMVIDNFVGHYEGAQYPLSAGVYNEDLRVRLHLHSIYTIPPLRPDWRVRWAASHSSGVFRDWPDVPSVLCVTFTVPRRSLRVLLNNKDTSGVPSLECRVGYPHEGHTYTPIHAIWGRYVIAERSDVVHLEEDPEGINGKSDLVLMFWATSRVLEFPGMSVILRLKRTIHSMQVFTTELGRDLDIFSAKIDDKTHVRFMPYRPSLASEDPLSLETVLASVPNPTASVELPLIEANAISSGPYNKRHVIAFTAHIDIQKSAQQEALTNGAKVVVAGVSPCTIQLLIGDHQHIISYPYPIMSSKHQLRVERESYRIEINVPVSQPFDSSGYYLEPVPIIFSNPWNVHHVSLDRMPRLDLEADSKKLEWLYPHTALQLSNRELEIRNGSSTTGLSATNIMLGVKDAIRTIVINSSGIQDPKTRVIKLCDSDATNAYAILLVGGLRLDLASFTVIIDAALVPLSGDQTLTASSVEELQGDSMVAVVTNGDETSLLKKLLRGFVERCRTWSHTPNCEYAAQDGTSLSTETERNLVCSCGNGAGFNSPEWKVESWKDLLPSATRAAISPLFGVSYIENGSGTAPMINTARPMTAGSGVRSQTRWDNACWICGGTGKPTLAACGRCKKAKYCSAICQGLDWKAHKKNCRKP
ncbi:hypothetical protein FRC09_001440 [Ceratobasidium sp. 395]|nr:hypothetical protein FRC09_001440 [Ceratobasidium sp. 395]